MKDKKYQRATAKKILYWNSLYRVKQHFHGLCMHLLYFLIKAVTMQVTHFLLNSLLFGTFAASVVCVKGVGKWGVLEQRNRAGKLADRIAHAVSLKSLKTTIAQTGLALPQNLEFLV